MSDRPYTADQLHHAAEAMGRYILGCPAKGADYALTDFFTARVKLYRKRRKAPDPEQIVNSSEVSIDALFNYLDKLHGIKRREKPPAPPPTKTI